MTLKELERRHKSGDKIPYKSVKSQIKEQLKRRCIQRGCNKSLAFQRKTNDLCETHRKGKEIKITSNAKKRPIKKYTKAETRRINKLKKQRYYAKHDIKFDKTIRKRKLDRLNPNVDGVLYDGRTLLYENYKEPLKPIEKTKGYGFYGTIAQTEDKMYIQCHVCGNLFSNLGGHLRVHKVTGDKYKETYELNLTTALVSDTQREKMQQAVFTRGNKTLPDHLAEYNRKVQAGEINHNSNHKLKRKGQYSLEWRNERGLCPDQLLEKIMDLSVDGVAPSYEEFNRHYGGRYIGAIKTMHGTYLQAVEKANLTSKFELKQVNKEKLIEGLIEFYEKYNRIPMTSDFNRGLLRDRGVYTRAFGTLNNARVEAGLDAVIPMPFGQIITLSPEEYIKYKNN